MEKFILYNNNYLAVDQSHTVHLWQLSEKYFITHVVSKKIIIFLFNL